MKTRIQECEIGESFYKLQVVNKWDVVPEGSFKHEHWVGTHNITKLVEKHIKQSDYTSTFEVLKKNEVTDEIKQPLNIHL